jgi:Omp85 superfamily domain
MSFSHHSARVTVTAACLGAVLAAAPAAAQDQAPPDTRAALIERAQAEKATALHPFEPGKAEAIFDKIEDAFLTGAVKVHPFFESAYAGGGFTLGAGYTHHISSYNFVDFRGSITFSGYKRIEALFVAPRVFDRRGTLTAIGGWREATQVGFYGFGTNNTSKHDRANYQFDQPYAAAALDLRPTRRYLLLHGGVELSTWNQGPGSGAAPSVDEVYTPETLPGLGASPTYFHSEAGIGFDSRTSPGYTRRGGYYGIEFHDFHDNDGQFGFRRTDYEGIQHIPILRDVWVLSLHGRVELANAAHDQTIPFFMTPSLGGGSSLRGFTSWRFRDLNSLLLQADWRVLANRFLDMALFYDAGKVAHRRSDLTDGPLKSDYGLGFRFHGPTATPLRIEFAHSNEGLVLVFSAKAPF